MKALISTLALALVLGACEGGASSPTQTSVTSPTSSPPASSPETEWTVTQSFVSVVGPDNCWVREQRARWTGAVFADLPMTVTRSGAAIDIEGDFFAVSYAGTISGNEFSASGGPFLTSGEPVTYTWDWQAERQN